MPNIRWLLALITRFQRWAYLRTDGAIGASIFGITMLLLFNKGRRSGREHIIPLLYIEDAGRYVIIASNAGDLRNPGWWHNLQANPRARIQVGRNRIDVVARAAQGEERARLWKRLTASYRYFDDYARRSQREIPVVVLEPAAGT
jgi:deazaflavin-dependent oxidoreductase (nitroreductase family)